ncbi:hypothetical protein FB567DRAFT_603224 [Paraphoma chrysanthemicola]|uniref:DUF7730 domain-containing protein n=1 Tax=Paraphoma chrysanthemicola TaxID=798071 RepID=A0A8K0R4B3_9PLEO|nr:hypothetical protein FB567DRAFT_603224 [Paraphoma chrysanthemicola]
MATSISIPYTQSRPVELSLPSFLTTLPPELRNRIYELLFKRNEPVLLHNAKAYHPKPPLRSACDSDEEYQLALEDCDRLIKKFDGADNHFIHNFPVALLQTCRQVYHEAVGILYGTNTFCFARTLHRDCPSYLDQFSSFELYDEVAYNPKNYALQWLSDIGAQVCSIYEISIDINAFYPARGWAEIPLLSLARYFWTNKTLQCNISIADVGSILSRHVDANTMQRRWQDSLWVNKLTLNNIVNAVIVDDALGISRFAYSSRLLDSIMITPDLTEAIVCYFPTGNERIPFQVVKKFTIARLGENIRFDATPSRGLQTISTAAHENIFWMACLSDAGIVFDLDTCTLRGIDMALFQCNRLQRNRFREVCLPDDYPFTIKMTSYKATAEFPQSRLIDDSVSGPGLPSNFEELLRKASFPHRGTTLALNFVLTKRKTLDEIRINVREFLVHSRCAMKARLQITVWGPNNSGIYQDQATIPMASLHKQMFLLLSDLILSWPDGLSRQWNSALPDIWVNGQGTPIKAVYRKDHTGPKHCVEHKYSHLDEQGFHHQGCLSIKAILAQLPTNGEFLRTGGGEMERIWNAFKQYYWDWPGTA